MKMKLKSIFTYYPKGGICKNKKSRFKCMEKAKEKNSIYYASTYFVIKMIRK